MLTHDDLLTSSLPRKQRYVGLRTHERIDLAPLIENGRKQPRRVAETVSMFEGKMPDRLEMLELKPPWTIRCAGCGMFLIDETIENRALVDRILMRPQAFRRRGASGQLEVLFLCLFLV